jgi:hypothetical protein
MVSRQQGAAARPSLLRSAEELRQAYFMDPDLRILFVDDAPSTLASPPAKPSRGATSTICSRRAAAAAELPIIDISM